MESRNTNKLQYLLTMCMKDKIVSCKQHFWLWETMKSLKLRKAIFSVSKRTLISATEMVKNVKKDCYRLKEKLKLKVKATWYLKITSIKKIASFLVDPLRVKNLNKSKKTLNKLRNSFKVIPQLCPNVFHLFHQHQIKQKPQTLQNTRKNQTMKTITSLSRSAKEVYLSKN
jgi:hypothetical protein